MRIFRFCCTLVIAAEQKARATYDNILRLSDDPDEQAKTEVIFAKNRNGQVGSVNMRYVGHLMKFEDEQSTFYESAMNAEQSPAKGRQNMSYPGPQVPPAAAPYNPFDEFDRTNNEFVQ